MPSPFPDRPESKSELESEFEPASQPDAAAPISTHGDAAHPVDRSTQTAWRTRWKVVRSHFLTRWIGLASLILLGASALRHLMLMSTAFDLGIYDQVAYLMSRGMEPISSYLGFHHMGNHTAYSFYLMAIPYAIYPSVYWLFGIQAFCLALGAWPTWLLARQAGLSPSLSSAMAAVYLLHPLIFNVNMFDFHPEVMGIWALLLSIWLARGDRKWGFAIAILFVLGCRDGLSVVIAPMGLWLLLYEKKRFCGIFALMAGVLWFVLATQWIIPTLSGTEAAAVGRYEALGGDSVLEVAINLILKPHIVLSKVLALNSLQYYALLLVPFFWGLSPRHLAPLISILPLVLLNVLSRNNAQRDLVHQYSLPMLPFLLTAVIDALAHGRGLIQQVTHPRRWILIWAIVVFVALAKYGRYYPEYAQHLDTWQASREALALIPRHEGGVITDNWHGAHLSQRSHISLLRGNRTFKEDLPKADYVLINLRHPWKGDDEMVQRMFARFQRHPDLELAYERDDVYLFKRRQNPT